MTVSPRRHAEQGSKLLALNFFPAFFPPASGGEQRAFYVLEELSKTRRVVSIAPTYREGRDEIVRHSANFEEYRFAKTDAYGAWHSAFRKADIAFGSQELAMALSISKHPAMARAVERHWADSDIILLQHPAVLPLIKNLDATGKRIVYLSHNCELELSGEKTGEAGWFSFMAMMGQLEARLCRMAHHVVVCSEDDGTKLKALYGTRPDKIILLRNGSTTRFPISEPSEFAATEPTRALFLGSDWGPNIEAVRTIVEGDRVGSARHHLRHRRERLQVGHQANSLECESSFPVERRRSGGADENRPFRNQSDEVWRRIEHQDC